MCLIVEFEEAVVRNAAPLLCLFALLTLVEQDIAVGAKSAIKLERVFGEHFLFQPDDRIGGFRLLVPKAGDLIVHRGENLIEPLVVEISFFNVTEMRLSVKTGCIACLGQHLRRRFDRVRHAAKLNWESWLAETHAERVLP